MVKFPKLLLLSGFSALLGGCLDPAETARVALGAKGVQVGPAAFVAAAAVGELDSLQLLKQAGVSPGAVDPKSGRSALVAAIEGGQMDVFDYLISAGADVTEFDYDGRTPLGAALESGRYAMAEKLLKGGADGNDAVERGGEAGVVSALRRGDIEGVELLIRYGADVELLDEHASQMVTQLTDAGRDQDLAKTLTAIGLAEPGSEAGGKGEEVLLVEDALARGLFRSAETLVGRGDMFSEGDGGELLVGAVADGDLRRLMELLHLGLDPNAVGTAGETALEWAVSFRDTRAAEMLLRAGAEAEPSLHAAVASGDALMVRMFLDHGTCPEGGADREAGDETPLCAAVRRSDIDIANLLLTAGADPSKAGTLGQPPLLLAAAIRDGNMVKTLLEGGADPDFRSISPHREDFRSLVSTKTLDYYLRNDTRLTAMMMASAQDDAVSLEHLLEHGAARFLYSGKYKRYAVSFAASRSHIYNQQRLLGRDPHNEEVKRKVVVDLSEQRARLYVDGKVVMSSRVSTGKKGYRTPAGNYVISNKYKRWTSTIYHSSMPYFQRLSCGSFGFHVGYVPNYPASHGCIRMPHSSAVSLFSKTKVGDFVQIVP